MNQRDLSQLKRRLNPDKRNPTVIRGCYVSYDGTIISTFAQPVFHLPAEENEKYMSMFKRVLSGTPGQNLQEIEFTGMQAMEGEEHKILSTMRESGLTDEEAVNAFYERVIHYIRSISPADAQSVTEQQAASNYLILLLHDGYDIAYRDQNGETDQEQSTDVFSYILCAVCPVKQTKPQLSYVMEDANFRVHPADWAVGAPDLGFLFPAYEEHSANIYKAMFYTRDASQTHEDFMKGVFGAERCMPAREQTETFQAVLQEALEDECSMDVVQAVHETVRTMIEEQKADKTAEPLSLSKQEVKQVLESCGVSEEKAQAFEEHYDETFGEFAELPAVNLVTPKQFKVDTPSVSIRVDPQRSDLIETRVIDGKNYILVLADGDVQVNGVNVKFHA
jgi:NACalpha-BTF3-like transcription factor